MKYFDFHVGDYLSKTAHLTLAEHGAFLLMMLNQYASERPIPGDRRVLYRLLRAETPAERKAVDAVAAEFWSDKDGKLSNRRCEEVLAAYLEWVEKQKANGKKGGRPPKTHTQTDGLSETQTDGLSQTKPNGVANGGYHAFPPPTSSPTSSPRITSQPTSERLRELFAEAQGAYPEFAGKQDWINAQHGFNRLIDQGIPPAALLDGVRRYATFCASGGVSSTKHVMTPGKFFTDHERPWSQAWAPPRSTELPQQRRAKTTEELEAEEAAHAKH